MGSAQGASVPQAGGRLRRLEEVDPEVSGAIEAEVRRQEEGLELIASEDLRDA